MAKSNKQRVLIAISLLLDKRYSDQPEKHMYCPLCDIFEDDCDVNCDYGCPNLFNDMTSCVVHKTAPHCYYKPNIESRQLRREFWLRYTPVLESLHKSRFTKSGYIGFPEGKKIEEEVYKEFCDKQLDFQKTKE